jgi:hypothetical protein
LASGRWLSQPRAQIFHLQNDIDAARRVALTKQGTNPCRAWSYKSTSTSKYSDIYYTHSDLFFVVMRIFQLE